MIIQPSFLTPAKNKAWKLAAIFATSILALSVVNVGPANASAASDLITPVETAYDSTAYWQYVATSSDGQIVFATQFQGGRIKPENLGGVYVSRDYGDSFVLGAGTENKDFLNISTSPDGSKAVATVYGGGIWVSSDFGVTWADTWPVSASDDFADTEFWYQVDLASDGMSILASTESDNLLYLSKDFGAHWSKLPAPNYEAYGVSVAPGGNKLAMLSYAAKGIWSSADSGATWALANETSGFGWTALSRSADGMKLVACAQESGAVWISNNYGVSWTKTKSVNGNWGAVSSSADGQTLTATLWDTNGYFVSLDRGETWTQNVSESKTYFPIISGDGSFIYLNDYAGLASASTGREKQVTTPVPLIQGIVAVGQTLTAVPGTWAAGVSFGYQWFKDGVVIPTANNATYKLTRSDLSHVVSVRVAGSKAKFRTVEKTSAATSAVGLLPSKVSAPTIAGVAKSAKTLRATSGTWANSTSVSYKWFRCSAKIATARQTLTPNLKCVAIARATKANYKVGSKDKKKYLAVQVTATNTLGSTSYFSASSKKAS